VNPPYDFDRPIDRRGTASIKWDRYEGREVIPMWVADTDFASPPAVLAALRDRVDHGVFGYGQAPRELVEVVLARLQREYAWAVGEADLVWLPGLVTGLGVACRALVSPGEAVLTSTPIYPPFLSCPRAMDAALQTAELGHDGARWVFDWERFEAAITPATRAYLLCSPHNPCGRLWERAELARLAEICARHDLVIVSDEIHNQLLLDADRPHVPTATLAPEVAARTITLMAPSKTYNLAGLGCAFAVITDPALRRRFTRAAQMIVSHPNVLGYVAALAAYRDGDDWLQAQLAYLRGNRDRLEEVVGGLPGLSMAHVEATYLGWLDARELGVGDPCAFFERHGLGFGCGKAFAGEGFVRVNFGCTRAVLEQALTRLRQAVVAVGR
jgi:cysteine-S-conjugate beta-lyase